MQTMVVHLRRPWSLAREIGFWATLRLMGMTGGVPISSALNVPGFLMLVWIAGRPAFVDALFPPITYFICMTMFLMWGAPLSVLVAFICTWACKPHL